MKIQKRRVHVPLILQQFTDINANRK